MQDQNRFLGTGRARRPWHDQSRPELEARGLVYILGVCERTGKLVRELVLDPGPLKKDARFDGVFVLRTNTDLAPQLKGRILGCLRH